MGSPITMITVARTTIVIALLMAIRPAAAGYFGEDKWIANCRYQSSRSVTLVINPRMAHGYRTGRPTGS
jgi:hypothetical protein